MKPHLYEDKDKVIHLCEGSQLTPRDFLVWTKCGKDVPANQSFETWYEDSNCDKCNKLEPNQDNK